MPQFQCIFMLFVAILFDCLLSLFQGHLAWKSEFNLTNRTKMPFWGSQNLILPGGTSLYFSNMAKQSERYFYPAIHSIATFLNFSSSSLLLRFSGELWAVYSRSCRAIHPPSPTNTHRQLLAWVPTMIRSILSSDSLCMTNLCTFVVLIPYYKALLIVFIGILCF